MNPIKRISRTPIHLASVLLVFSFLLFVAPESSHAKRLSKVELRKLGFTGAYRGLVSGGSNTWNGLNYTLIPVNQARTENVPTASTVLVTAPTGTNAFFLTHFPATGNSRKATIRARSHLINA